MPALMTRRFLLGSALLYPSLALTGTRVVAQQTDDPTVSPPELPAPAVPDTKGEEDADKLLAELEKRTGGRLGVSILDTETNISLGHRETERFPLCSTYKALAAGFVLARVDQGKEQLDRRVTYGKDVVVSYSPATESHAGTVGMTVSDLCQAAVTLSDNTARSDGRRPFSA